MVFLDRMVACLYISKADELSRSHTELSAEKRAVLLTDSCTQTDVPENTWLKEALALNSQSVPTKKQTPPALPTSQMSGISHESLHASALRSPEAAPAIKPARIEQKMCSNSMSEVNVVLESPGMHPSQPESEQQTHVEDLIVSSEAAHDEEQVKAELKRVFLEFAQFGTRSEAKAMDVFRFTKLCRECDLLSQPQETPSINLIFYKCKGNKNSKLTFGRFKMATRVIAEYLNLDVSEVQARIAQSDGPLVNNITLPQYIKQHDTVAQGHSPTASQRNAMTQSFMNESSQSRSIMGSGMGSMMGATPRDPLRHTSSLMGGSTPRELQLRSPSMMGATPLEQCQRTPSQMGGSSGLMQPNSAVRRARTQEVASAFDRKATSKPVGAWR